MQRLFEKVDPDYDATFMIKECQLVEGLLGLTLVAIENVHRRKLATFLRFCRFDEDSIRSVLDRFGHESCLLPNWLLGPRRVEVSSFRYGESPPAVPPEFKEVAETIGSYWWALRDALKEANEGFVAKGDEQ